MGKYFGVIVGAIIILLGVIGLISWRGDLLTVLKGSVPAILILGGTIAVIAGLSEIKDEISEKKESK